MRNKNKTLQQPSTAGVSSQRWIVAEAGVQQETVNQSKGQKMEGEPGHTCCAFALVRRSLQGGNRWQKPSDRRLF